VIVLCAPHDAKKKAVEINLSPEVVDYFKGLAEEAGLPYRKLVFLSHLVKNLSSGLLMLGNDMVEQLAGPS
jgi:hypothetical protein